LNVLEANPTGSPTVLFLHGWLDHAHGFDLLRAVLPPTWRTVALDFRGHGQSGQASGGLYGFTDYLADVEFTLDALDVSRVHLVGHSLGGSVALTYAAAHPSRVASVTSIDSIGPTGGEPERVVERLQRFLRDLHKPPRRRTWPTLESAAARLRENLGDLSEEASLHLARYGTRPVAGGFEFTFDPAHRRAFGLVMDEAQVLAVFRAVEAPVRIIRASHGLPFDEARVLQRLEALRAGPAIVLTGGHHLHLDAPEEVAQVLRKHIP
jgi:pimeloyl-ACP methyl ester carboxylesterase